LTGANKASVFKTSYGSVTDVGEEKWWKYGG